MIFSLVVTFGWFFVGATCSPWVRNRAQWFIVDLFYCVVCLLVGAMFYGFKMWLSGPLFAEKSFLERVVVAVVGGAGCIDSAGNDPSSATALRRITPSVWTAGIGSSTCRGTLLADSRSDCRGSCFSWCVNLCPYCGWTRRISIHDGVVGAILFSAPWLEKSRRVRRRGCGRSGDMRSISSCRVDRGDYGSLLI